ncbi:hypothetical protein ACQW5G_00590 [Fructilactobacillus sp. Tb1]|uniref:hypothetical protein n=1 Tax=Fructilactobacillus sp. Tb1 TaxID=3422304 RepID=UPI003D2C418B
MLLNILCILGIIFLVGLTLLVILIAFIVIRTLVKLYVENARLDKEFYETKRKIEESNKKIDDFRKQHNLDR